MSLVTLAPRLQTAEPLAVLAGGGTVPTLVAGAAARAGRPVLIVGIIGEAEPAISAFPHRWVRWGEIGRLLMTLRMRRIEELVLVGRIKSRPDYRQLDVDRGGRLTRGAIARIFEGGDNSVLLGAVHLFEQRGFRIVGAHQVARELVVSPGRLSRAIALSRDEYDSSLAFTAAEAIGKLDIGQAAVAVDGRVIAVEGAEGTDSMLERVAALRRSGRIAWQGRAGAFAKCAKPHQDLRVDMPTIGPGTVAQVAAAGLAGIVIEAGKVMIAEREETIRSANAHGLFLIAREGSEGDS